MRLCRGWPVCTDSMLFVPLLVLMRSRVCRCSYPGFTCLASSFISMLRNPVQETSTNKSAVDFAFVRLVLYHFSFSTHKGVRSSLAPSVSRLGPSEMANCGRSSSGAASRSLTHFGRASVARGTSTLSPPTSTGRTYRIRLYQEQYIVVIPLI
jgi:hypothetical protein